MDIKVAIIDYGLGNLFSINNACKLVGLNTIITKDIDVINNADALILPGVGAFGAAMAKIRARIPLDILSSEVREKGKPFLGICVGMQVLACRGHEFGVFAHHASDAGTAHAVALRHTVNQYCVLFESRK